MVRSVGLTKVTLAGTRPFNFVQEMCNIPTGQHRLSAMGTSVERCALHQGSCRQPCTRAARGPGAVSQAAIHARHYIIPAAAEPLVPIPGMHSGSETSSSFPMFPAKGGQLL
jgi:hypothetical protein